MTGEAGEAVRQPQPEILLHFGKCHGARRTYARAGFTSFTIAGSCWRSLAIYKVKNTYRTVVYTFLTAGAGISVNSNKIHDILLLGFIQNNIVVI